MDASELGHIDFGAQSEAKWRTLAAKALKGADVDAALSSYTDDGIKIEASAARVVGAEPLFARERQGWSVVQRIDDPDVTRAATQAKMDIEGGATGLSLVFEGAPSGYGYGLPLAQATVAAVLDGIALDGLTLRIEPHGEARATADWLASYLASRKANMSKIHLSLGIDHASCLASTGGMKMNIAALEASLPQSLAGFFAAGIRGVLFEADGRVYHDAGASEAQELGAILSVATSHLRMFEKARQPVSYAAEHIGFAVSLDQDQFVSIAKLRALRLLWARVLELSSVEKPVAPKIHAETSWRMLSYKDCETNILRSSIAVFSGAVGGANSLSVLPHTYSHGLPDASARRIARNTHLVLKDESMLGFVDDPVAGSGSIEQLTAALCAAAWAQFQQLESEGGVLRSLAANLFQKRIGAMAEKRSKQYQDNVQSVIGTNVFPIKDERPVTVLSATKHQPKMQAAFNCDVLVPISIVSSFGSAQQ
jgi:methylmalonyl-CoA mutase